MVRRTWTAASAWLNRVPIRDPVDRKNAPFMQLVLLFFGVYLPINLYYYLVVSDFISRAPAVSTALNAATDLAIIASAWTGFYLIRRGQLRKGVMLFLGTVLVSLTVVFLQTGLRGLVIDTTYPVLSLAIGGLVLGRGALWKVFGSLVLMLALGALTDLFRHAEPAHAYAPNWAMSAFLLYGMITIVLDRTILALRSSLDESVSKGRALADANLRLQREMAERERAQSQLIHAQKMEAVGRVASGVAHDFDNVLNVALGYAVGRERIADRGTSALIDALEGVELSVRRALSISRKLLNFGRQDTSRPEVFDAVAALRELQPMLRQLFGAGTRVSLDVGDDVLLVRMDRGQFELMALNIAANARDAMPEGGRFIVGAQRAQDGTIELTFGDTGCGMPESVRMRAFEPFYTTKSMGSGTGLGLAVTQDLVREMGGSIDVASTSEAGTTFAVRLPLVAAAA
ncbi:ATP-binding protein [Lysobacter sp. KIS68-7]|uniref:sensor histidine kinase n=1 Tax=Lysobacter sp. KIS68-7 TaxID=2904252 RepID=UPI001E478CF3|nr:ATP-binding protein [Lysobacter sp. KIS68-7]UHQ20177.1 ATP-binding protein [Lysobacter sp. KIS68-7]